MRCPLILLAMAFSLVCARLSAQGACVQSESDPVAKCMDCEAESIPAGITIEESVSTQCQGGGDCPSCCWECEAVAYGSGLSSLAVYVVGESPGDIDVSSPFIVQLDAKADCKRGTQGSFRCVKFVVAKLPGPEYGALCYQLTCDPCIDIESE